MRRLALLSLLLTACAPQGQDPQFTADLTRFDREYEAAQSDLKSSRGFAQAQKSDMRRRRMTDDLTQWVFLPATQSTIRSLRERAIEEGATSRLEEARQLVRAEYIRFDQIDEYWRNSPAPFWRRQWQQFSIANDMPESPPPRPLLDAERRLIAQLDAGDFRNANADGVPRLIAQLRAAQKSAIPIIAKRRLAGALRFQERKAPCGAAVAPDQLRRAPKIMDGPPVENFYPRNSANLGEEGPVVLRLRISRTGCVRAGAILVHSGFAELDQAALNWMETAQYSPGSENGSAVEALTSIKVLFKIEDQMRPEMTKPAKL